MDFVDISQGLIWDLAFCPVASLLLGLGHLLSSWGHIWDWAGNSLSLLGHYLSSYLPSLSLPVLSFFSLSLILSQSQSSSDHSNTIGEGGGAGLVYKGHDLPHVLHTLQEFSVVVVAGRLDAAGGLEAVVVVLSLLLAM